jgi:hypothetical protein
MDLARRQIMQTELHLLRSTSRHAAVLNRAFLNCDQLERRDAPSASPLAAVAAPVAVVNHDVFALNNATDAGHAISDGAYSQALQNHAAAVLQDFATPAVAAVNGVVHAAAKSTSTSLTVSTHATTAGHQVTLTATVSAWGTSAKPYGTVTFKDGSKVLGTATLDAHGVARLTTTKLPAGTDHVTAVYAGNTHYKSSTSAAVTVTVTSAAHTSARSTTITLTASTHAATAGQKVTLTATVSVSGSSAHPGGTVTFKDGSKVVGTATLDAHGVARLTKPLSVGTHQLTAVFSGNASYKGSTSAATTVRVTTPVPPRPSTKVTLENVGNVTTAGMPLVLEATVRGSLGGAVTILDGGHSLGQFEIDRSGHAAVALNLGLPAGRHTLTVLYQNATGSVHATGSVNLTLTPSATPMW